MDNTIPVIWTEKNQLQIPTILDILFLLLLIFGSFAHSHLCLFSVLFVSLQSVNTFKHQWFFQKIPCYLIFSLKNTLAENSYSKRNRSQSEKQLDFILNFKLFPGPKSIIYY
jgi:hypothetical protein